MDSHGENDVSLQKKLEIKGRKISRVQVLRIRKGEVGASKQTAQALEAVTGIAWHEFIGPFEPAVETIQQGHAA